MTNGLETLSPPKNDPVTFSLFSLSSFQSGLASFCFRENCDARRFKLVKWATKVEHDKRGADVRASPRAHREQSRCQPLGFLTLCHGRLLIVP
jgi:hypothetical protein